MNYFKILFLLLLFTSGVFANKNELIKPKENQTIIDIGYKNPQSKYEVSVSPDWKYYSTLIKDVDKLVQAKNRVLSEKYDCETDYLGRENCSVNQVSCTASLQQSDGFATKINKTRIVNKIKKESSNFSNRTIEGDRLIPLNIGAYTGTLFNLVYGATGFYNPQTMFNDGYQKNGKFAIKMFNFGSGWGSFAIFPVPNKVTVIHNNGAIINVGSGASGWPNALISTPDATFATILAEWNTIPSGISYSCDDYCMISKPENVLGVTEWACPDTFVDADGIKSAQGKCKKDYSYYKYECTKDTNGYDRPWVGPVVNNGEDCNANCGANGCICNSPTPPKNNCVRDDFICPFDKNQLCTITTEDKSSQDNILNGHIFDQGFANTFSSVIEKDKLCTGGYKWDSKTNICVSPTEYSCLQEGFVYNPLLDECMREIPCLGEMVNGKCIEDAKAECPTGYSYNKSKYRCEANPICDTGIYNTISNLCESQITCPTGFVFSSINKRCEKLTSINRFNCGTNETLKNGSPNYCITTPTLAQAGYAGNVSRSWYVSPVSLNNNLPALNKALKDIVDVGDGDITLTKSGNNYIVGNTSKKAFSISLSSGGSLTVPAKTSFTVLPNGFQVGASVITGTNAMATFTISKVCGLWSDVSATEDAPSYKICSDTSDKYGICSPGFEILNGICFKTPTCGAGYVLSSNKMSCVKNLSCPQGFLADYSKNGCVKIEGGYELSLGESVYIHELSCIGGISQKGTCQVLSSCSLNGKLEIESDRCVLLAKYSCSTEKTGKCKEGFYYQNGKCLSVPKCEKGQYDMNTGKCSEIAKCDLGYFMSAKGKCIKEVETKDYVCLSTESLYKGTDKDVCRISKVGACKVGYKESLNPSYCERDVVCPTGYSVDNKNRTCVKGV